jgi:hypothetical protein
VRFYPPQVSYEDQAMQVQSRRSFNRTILSSLIGYGLIETLVAGDLLADTVKPIINRWVLDLQALGRELKDQRLSDIEFQNKLEELYKKVELDELVRLIDLDRLAQRAKLPDNGAASLAFDLSKVDGLPKRLVFGKQIFGLKKGRSVVPHGHDNMCTGFVVLRGTFRGRHYDRVEDHDDHYLIKPTIDRTFKPAEFSTVSDHRDNVHWFQAESETGFIFNIHVDNYDPINPKTANRVYVDPEGEKVRGGLIVARKIGSSACHKKYG